jgi:hypothetical protein
LYLLVLTIEERKDRCQRFAIQGVPIAYLCVVNTQAMPEFRIVDRALRRRVLVAPFTSF